MKSVILAAALVAALVFAIVYSGCATSPNTSPEKSVKEDYSEVIIEPVFESDTLSDSETVGACLAFIGLGCARDIRCFAANREDGFYPYGATDMITDNYDMAMEACKDAFGYMCLGVKNFSKSSFEQCKASAGPDANCEDPPSEACLELFTPE